jgi:hypothetical protein
MTNNTTNHLDVLLRTNKPSQQIYRSLMTKIATYPTALIQKWQHELETDEHEINENVLKQSFDIIYKSTPSTKIRSFQFCLVHRCLGINQKLYEWGMAETNLCSLCNSEVETYYHLFYKCDKVQGVWRDIKEWTLQSIGHQAEISPTAVILGSKTWPVINMIIMATKLYIYYCKMKRQTPSTEALLKRIEDIKKIERYIAVKNNKINQFERKWTPHL